ncbi:MAG: hypothetical protein ACXW07_07915 [Nitrososphaeraceae archaeon]
MRLRYWHLTISEILNAKYPTDKVNHWEIKCLYGEHEHFGIFWYKYGTPFDKEPVHGICFYYNEIPEKIVRELTDYLVSKFGGKILTRQSRVFLDGSKEIHDPYNIGQLANEISLKFSIPVEITLEFEKVTKEEVDNNSFNFPSKKVLPIVGID